MRGCNKHLSDCHVLSGITVPFTQRTLRPRRHLKLVKELVSEHREFTSVFQDGEARRHEAAPRSMNFFP